MILTMLALAAVWVARRFPVSPRVIRNGEPAKNYFPFQHAGRFSKNAVIPSCAS